MLKVLVVEDDKFISAIFSFFLKDLGYTLVGRCQSGINALEVIKKEPPDVVLMDIHLEGEMDGIHTAERIQRDHEIPVIFISSDTSNEVVERAIIANSYGYLVKPVQKKELGITIDLAYYKHKVMLDQKRREQSFRQFISDAPVPIVIVANRQIFYLNMSALELLHSHYIEDIIGLPFMNFVSPGSFSSFNSIFDEPFRPGKKINRFDATLKRLNGKVVDVGVDGSWLRFNNRDALQLVLSDIAPGSIVSHDAQVMDKILTEGHGAIMELNSSFNVSGYNKAFSSLVQPTHQLTGSSLFNLPIAVSADTSLIESHFSNCHGQPLELELVTSKNILKCKLYPLNYKGDKPDRVIVAVYEVIPVD